MCTEAGERASESAGERNSASSKFSVGRVQTELALSTFAGKLHHFATIDSTQARALLDAQAGAEAGQVYIADEQTAGRGRGGHTWHSEPGSGLYVTVLMRPALKAEHVPCISLAAGLAAQAAVLSVCGLRIDLRWPNDLVTVGPGSRKLGGILTESAMQTDGSLRHAAIGFGVNLNQEQMPEELRNQSASLRMILGVGTAREDLLIALLRQLEDELERLTVKPAAVLERFASRSSWVHGKRVSVAEDEGYTGVTNGLTNTGLLRVRCDDGSLHVVRHGGVRELL